ncbi:ABC transporter permease [Streptomyces sp. NPDC048483]|uniref:ABC transporter permease n=1 Tax=Streptomyces sp. NPDC048483 TaxID=3154927 RepID=UPI003421CF64
MLNALAHAYRSECVKTLRARVLVPLLAGTGAVAAAAAAIMVALTHAPAAGGHAAAASVSGGMLKPLQTATSVLCLVLMAVAATSFTHEYRYGTWRNLLVRLPHRPSLLAGKAAGLVALAALVALTACLATGATAWITASVRGLDTSPWTSASGWFSSASAAARVLAALAAGTLYGAAAGLLLRSTGAALSVVFAWILVGESVVTGLTAARGWTVAAWLPGSSLTHLASDAHWAPAALSAALWCAVCTAGSVWHFNRTTRLG